LTDIGFEELNVVNIVLKCSEFPNRIATHVEGTGTENRRCPRGGPSLVIITIV